MKYNILIILFVVFMQSGYCQKFTLPQKNDFSISIGLNYITSASIQLNPFSADIIERNTMEDIKGGYSVGFSIKKKLFIEDFYVSLSTEYLSIKDKENYETLSNDTSIINFGVTEELKVIPIEATLIYKLPRFVDNFDIYIGGGAGIYLGDRIRTLYRYKSETLEKKIYLNLNVMLGVEYYLSSNVSAYFDMKFREGEYEVKSRYQTNVIEFDGLPYYFNPDIHSRIYVDGIRFSGGINYYFR